MRASSNHKMSQCKGKPCSYCQEWGHFWHLCPNTWKCYNCYSVVHATNDCPQPCKAGPSALYGKSCKYMHGLYESQLLAWISPSLTTPTPQLQTHAHISLRSYVNFVMIWDTVTASRALQTPLLKPEPYPWYNPETDRPSHRCNLIYLCTTPF